MPIDRSDMRELLYGLRGVGETLTCDRCGYTGHPDEFEPEEAGEWECRPCNTRLNAEEAERNRLLDAGP